MTRVHGARRVEQQLSVVKVLIDHAQRRWISPLDAKLVNLALESHHTSRASAIVRRAALVLFLTRRDGAGR